MYWCFYQQNTLCHVFDTLYRVSPFSIRMNFSYNLSNFTFLNAV